MRKKQTGRIDWRRDPQRACENALRPCLLLEYDRDQPGVYFMECEAFELAESQFGRAVWLNPYEPWFKLHWATALFALKQMDEAKRLLSELMTVEPCAREAERLLRNHWPAEPPLKR